MDVEPIRISIVEDHPVFREGLSTIIGSQRDLLLVAQATNAVEALSEFRRTMPAITLMDVRLSGSDGIDALIGIRGEFPHARVIMLTTLDSNGEIQRALRAGASAYILKSMPGNELLDVVRAVHSGQRRVSPEVAVRLAEHMCDEDLTTREIEVLRLICDGFRNKQIADELAIAETTVNYHIKHLLDKPQANESNPRRNNRNPPRSASGISPRSGHKHKARDASSRIGIEKSDSARERGRQPL